MFSRFATKLRFALPVALLAGALCGCGGDAAPPPINGQNGSAAGSDSGERVAAGGQFGATTVPVDGGGGLSVRAGSAGGPGSPSTDGNDVLAADPNASSGERVATSAEADAESLAERGEETVAAVAPADDAVAAAPPVDLSALPDAEFPARLTLEENGYLLSMSPDGGTLAVEHVGETTFYDVRTAREKCRFTTPHGGSLAAHRFSPDGRWFAAVSTLQGGDPPRVHCSLHDVRDGRMLKDAHFSFIPGGALNEDYVAPLDWSGDGRYLAFPGDRGSILVWDLEQGREHARLKGHAGPIRFLQFAGEGRLFSYGDDQVVRRWPVDGGEAETLISAATFHQVLVLPDGNSLLALPDGDWTLWDVSRQSKPGILKRELPELPRGRPRLLADGRTAAFTHDSGFSLWELPEGKPLAKRESPAGTTALLSGDGRTMIEIGDKLRLWDVANGQMRQVLDEPQGWIGPAVISDDGGILAVTYDREIVLYSSRYGQGAAQPVGGEIALFQHNSPVRSVRFSADGATLVAKLLPNPLDAAAAPLAAGADDRSDACAAIFKRHAPGGGISAAAAKEMIQVVGKPFVDLLAEQDRTFHWGELAAVWNVAERQQRAIVKQPPMNETDLARIDPNGAGAFREIQALMVKPVEPADVSPHRLPPLLLGDSHLVWLDRQQGVMRMDLATQETEAIVAPQAVGLAWALSPDGGTLLVKSAQPGKLRDRRGDFLDLATKALRGPVTSESHSWFDRDIACRFSPDGALVAVPVVNENDAALKLIDAATGDERPLQITVEWDVAALTFSPDGGLLAFIDGKPIAEAEVSFGHLRLIDVETGQERPTLIKDTVYSLAFSPDGQTLAAVSNGGTTVLLLDVESGQVRGTIDDFTALIAAVAFSPDSRLLAVAGGEFDHYPAPAYEIEAVQAELKIFSAAGGKLLLALAGHRHLITSAAFSPDGHTLATGSWDRTVRLWECAGAGE